MEKCFERLVTDALKHDFSGWDFSFLSQRWRMSPTSWDYSRRVRERMRMVDSLLDMGTGGGEFLSSIGQLPPRTCATEAYEPNLPIARERLEPLGVEVVGLHSHDVLPFEEGTFDLVIDRHEFFSAPELYRVLRPGGRFITQQVGGRDNLRLGELLQAPSASPVPGWGLAAACRQLKEAGLCVIERIEEFPETTIFDVGAVVYYLKAIPWQIPDFDVDEYRGRLRALHERIQEEGPLVLTSHRFFIEATKR